MKSPFAVASRDGLFYTDLTTGCSCSPRVTLWWTFPWSGALRSPTGPCLRALGREARAKAGSLGAEPAERTASPAERCCLRRKKPLQPFPALCPGEQYRPRGSNPRAGF